MSTFPFFAAPMRIRAILPAVIVAIVGHASLLQGQPDTPIPRSVGGDQGRYVLLEATRSGDIARSVHKRVGPSGTGYTKMEINCRTMLVRDLGYSETSVAAIKDKPSKWFDLVRGSSKSDVALFVCRRTARPVKK